MKKFFVFLHGEVRGPYTPDEIKAMPEFNRGTMLFPEDLENGTSEDWKPAYQIPDLNPIPFTPVKAPTIVPTIRSAQPNKETQQTDAGAGQTDTHVVSLMEQLRHLETEFEKIKKQTRDIDSIKLQLGDKDRKLYELFQEFRKFKEESGPATGGIKPVSGDAVPVENKSVSAAEGYSQVEIPLGKIFGMIVLAAVLGCGIWALIPGSRANKYVKSISPGAKQKEPMVQTAGTAVIPSAPQPVPAKKEEKPQVPAKPRTDEKALAKSRLEKEIVQKYKDYKALKERVQVYIDRGIATSVGNPEREEYMNADTQAKENESELRDLNNKYKITYGKPAWDDFVERTKKTPGN